MKKLGNRGFTIIELVIATLVFTTVLIICMEAITRITNVYIKNTSVSKANEFAESFVLDITQQIKFGSVPLYFVPPLAGGNVAYLCLADSSYKITFAVADIDTATPSKPILKIPSASGCSGYNLDSSYASGVNIAPSRMRILKFKFNPVPGTAIYEIGIRASLGPADLLKTSAKPNGLMVGDPVSDFADATCRSLVLGSSFCAIVELNTSASKRMIQ